MASQYPLNNDEVDDVLEDEETVDDETLEDNESDVSYAAKPEVPADFSVAARERLREELSRQVDAFLARGGHIDEIPSKLHDARPKKPVSDFSDRLM